MKERKLVFIVAVLIIAMGGVFYFSFSSSLKSVNQVNKDESDSVAFEYEEDLEDDTYDFIVGDSGSLKEVLNIAEEDTIQSAVSSDSSIVLIDDEFQFKILNEGEVKITYLLSGDSIERSVNFSTKSTVSLATTSSVFSSNSIDKCSNFDNAVWKENAKDKTKAFINRCVDRYTSSGFQNVALTSNYFYMIVGYSSGANAITRINRINGSVSYMRVENAGHGQSFDVIGKNNNIKLFDGDTVNDDILFYNYFNKLKSGTDSSYYHFGFGLSHFSAGNNIIPTIGYGVLSSNHTGVKATSNGISKNTTTYRSIKENKNSTYVTNPYIATDGANDRLLICKLVRNKSYIASYSCNVFSLKGYLSNSTTVKSLYSFTFNETVKDAVFQGLDVRGNYLYVSADKFVNGQHYAKEHYIRKIDIRTGKSVKFITYSTGRLEENEGITIQNNNIYVSMKECQKNSNGSCTKVLNLYQISNF